MESARKTVITIGFLLTSGACFGVIGTNVGEFGVISEQMVLETG